jgi:hypothetical protein
MLNQKDRGLDRQLTSYFSDTTQVNSPVENLSAAEETPTLCIVTVAASHVLAAPHETKR